MNIKIIKIASVALILALSITGCILQKLKTNKVEQAIDHVVFVECFKHLDNGTTIRLGHGSGVVVDKARVITNWHVVESTDSISISFNTFETSSACILRRDESLDLALLQTENTTVKPIEFSNSSKVEVSQPVYAIGHPLGLRNTVTSGIISFPERYSRFLLNSFIQTDCAINPGSSGGALVDKNGELLGITTSFVSNNGGFSGYSFSVPSNTVKIFIK